MENEVKPALSMFATVQEYKDAVLAFDAANPQRRAEDAERLPAEKLEWPDCGACPGNGAICQKTCKLAEESPPSSAAPAVDAAKLPERLTVGEAAKAVGAWENEAGYVCFGTWEAVKVFAMKMQRDLALAHVADHPACGALPVNAAKLDELGKLKALAEAAKMGPWILLESGEFIGTVAPTATLRIAALVAQQAARIAELEQQLEAGGRDRALGAAIQRAAGELPDGWEIRVDVENGAGTATLYDPAGESRPLDGGDGLAGDIEFGIELATQEGK